MKVRAKQDGHYGGYYRIGPHENADGSQELGEVFEIDATPHAVLDHRGKPLQEMQQTGDLDNLGRPVMKPVWILGENGKPKRDGNGNLIAKTQMATFFSPEWMEPVNDDATVTYPDQSKPLGIIAQMRPGKQVPASTIAARPANLPPDVAAVLEGKQKAESPI